VTRRWAVVVAAFSTALPAAPGFATAKDGSVDVEDACPKVPGRPDVDRTRNGCPKARVIADPLLVIADRIHFESNETRLRPRGTPTTRGTPCRTGS
jgi:hypothetical protein